MSTKKLWLRWLAANALGEMFGLGANFAISILALMFNLQGTLVTLAIAAVCSMIEGSMVGLAQWWAMYPWFPDVSRRSWWLATLIGVLMVYILDYLPGILILDNLAMLPQWPAGLPLTAGMGVMGGGFVSSVQWLAMRKSVQGARVWIPANMLAWAIGLPVIFWGIELADKMLSTSRLALALILASLLAGAIVGAVHGLFLVKLARRRK